MENEFEHKFMPLTSLTSGHPIEVVDDVLCLPNQIVNVLYIGRSDNPEGFTVVDAGMPNSAEEIIEVAERRFGPDARPNCIILTHGHFDHVGSIIGLIEKWNVPVYAHPDELPYLQGQANYPPGDPDAGGGLVSRLSPTFPNHGIDLEQHVQALPEDGSVPFLPEWRWIHTPGHTPGQISLYRARDKTLIAGDAFTTVEQESLYDVFTQKREIHGPPAYFTPDWDAAWTSVKKLAELEPAAVITGHGLPMYGDEIRQGLRELALHFDELEIPKHHRHTD